MADKTMPERIRVLQNFSHIQITPLCERAEHDGTYRAVDAQDEQAAGIEYVRADIAAGDPNEPIEDGQYRWCRVNEEGRWEPVAIKEGYGRLVYYIAGEEQNDYVEDCYEMGPVIRPPADTAS